MTKSDTQSSEFFKLAKQADLLSEKKFKVSKIKTYIKNASLYAPVIGNNSPAIEMNTDIGLDNASVVVLSTAEAEAVGGAGLFTKNSRGEYKFCLPRFHIGPKAQLDMSVAISQLATTKLMQETIDASQADNSGIIQFTREGHLTSWQIAMWLASAKNIPTTLIKISHKKADNPFTRVAHIEGELNLEGFATKLKTLYISDPVASGMQHVAMIEYLEKINRLPEEIVVIAPMATLFGLQVIGLSCQKRGIKFKAGVLGSLLDSKTPLRYFSPYPSQLHQLPNHKLAKFIQNNISQKINSWCIRCNWTASFMGGTELPKVASDNEITDLGLTHLDLIKLQTEVTIGSAKKLDLDQFLVPYSTKLLVN